MAQQTINVGTAPNDGTGTPLRTAFQYTNSNFSELYTAVGPSGNNIVCPGSATITGDLTVDTSTLKVDSANNRVGVNTASPIQTLDVVGNSFFRGATAGVRIGDNSGSAFISCYDPTISTAKDLVLQTGGGNVGLGVTPSASWASGWTALSIKNAANSILSNGSTLIDIVNNALVGGSGWQYVNTAAASRYEASGGTHAWFNAGSGTAGNAIVWTQAMTLDASGFLSVGTTTPRGQITAQNDLGVQNGVAVVNTGTTYGQGYQFARFINSAAAYAGSISHTAATGIGLYSAGELIFGSNSTAVARFDASGNLLVGKTANYGTGEVNTLQLKSLLVFASDNTGSASNRNWAVSSNGSAAGNIEWTVSSSNNGWPNFAYRMQLTSAGAAYNTTGTWGTISDLRLKENISDARNYLSDLLKLRVVKYSLKEEASAVATKIGFIAQEVEQVFPNLIEKSDKEYEGGEGIRTVKTTVLIPMLLKAIQELTARVIALENK